MDIEVARIKRYLSKPQFLCNLGTKLQLAKITFITDKDSEQMSKTS